MSYSTGCRDASHYVVPDAEALVACLEIMELPEMGNYILLTSVLKQVTVLSSNSSYALVDD